MSYFHKPVLLNESIDLLSIQKDNWYIDCNLGGGGHTAEILKRGGKVLGIDWDSEAIEEVRGKLASEVSYGRLVLKQANFTKIKELVDEIRGEKVAGVMFDLGVSSHQFDKSERGFSFQSDAPLDMRMSPELSVRAADLINGLNEGELAELFWKLGEEKQSRKIARRIVEYRKRQRLETTRQLADLVKSAVFSQEGIHPATKVFQALRIAVNDELNNLKEVLPKALEVLEKDGRMVVISFHSLEDRIVKDQFRLWSKEGRVRIINNKPITPTDDEIYENPRSRSAKLRVIEKN